jgi:hypothetical protein
MMMRIIMMKMHNCRLVMISPVYHPLSPPGWNNHDDDHNEDAEMVDGYDQSL